MNIPAALYTAAAVALVFAPSQVWAQRAAENAVASADDAFGTSVGLETTGIYTDNDTRGFSPVKAGNARIDGIYYDPLGNLSGRLRGSTAIRVGFAAEDFPFQAPTGIADYRLRPFPEKRGMSIGHNFMPFGGVIQEIDIRLPIVAGKAYLTGGFARADLPQSDGSGNRSWGVTVRPMFRAGGIEFSPFVAMSTFYVAQARPLVVVRGDVLPKLPRKRVYLGQSWARGRNDNNHFGATLRAPITDRLSLRAGLFRAEAPRERNFSEIFTLAATGGLANHRLIADPQQDLHSTSGEALLALRLGEGAWQHRLFAGYRARDRLIETGGSDVRNFGDVPFGTRNPQAEPDFIFAPVNVGRVRQSSLMLGYIGRVAGVGSLNLGLQKARYRGRVRDGRTGAVSVSRDDPWLYNATAHIDVAPKLSVYAGTQRGLEDSGTAPENAANRNAQLPATRATQYEGGVRWRLRGGQLVVNAFQITKPYFSFDAAGLFTRLGTVRHRGLEASLSGRFGKRLSIVAGGALLQPRVSGFGRDTGLLGKRPAGTPSLFGRMDVNYRTDILGGLTPTASVIYTGERAVSARPLASLGGRQLMAPAVATVDLGLRQQIVLGGVPGSFRAVVQNAFDTKAWRVIAPNTLQVDERRRFTLALAADL